MLLDKNGHLVSVGDVVDVDSNARQYSLCKAETGWIVRGSREYHTVTEVVVEHTKNKEWASFPLQSISIHRGNKK